jgi:DNA-directed RNA polymerase I, II, and III subunit RPABC3
MFYSDVFEIVSTEPKKFDRVSRHIARSSTSTSTKIIMDINCELFPITVGETLTIAMASGINLDSNITPEEWIEPTGSTLMDSFDYVTYGKVYKTLNISKDTVEIYVSFGGLLMCISGDPNVLKIPCNKIYFLIKRIS